MDVREKLVELPIEDAILVLREEHRQRTDGYITYLEHGGKGDPAEEVGLDALAMAISALEKTKWISVEDRLPEVGGYVVCIAKRNPFSRFMPMVARIEKNGWVNLMTEQYISEVTHWMHLPEPPKEKRTEG